MLKPFTKIFAFFMVFIAIGLSQPALSQEDEAQSTQKKIRWGLHQSPSGSFDVRFPKEHDYKLFPFRLDDDLVAYAGEILATHDERPYKDSIKSYLVTFQQTLGNPLSVKEAAQLLDQEAQKYILGAEHSGGTILSDEIIDVNGYVARDLHIAYGNSQDKKEGMRVRIAFTNVARIQQVFSSTDGGLFGYRTNDFFDSIRFSDGFAVSAGRPGEDWREFPSAHNIFTMRVPQKHPDYTPDDPKFKTANNYDAAYMMIMDPVVKKLTYYNIHAFKTGKTLDQDWVLNFLFTEYVKKFVPKASFESLRVDKEVKDNYGTMSTKLVFSPHKSAPYVDAVLLRASYVRDFIVVQEVIGAQGHVFGPLGHTLIESMLFHPENFTEDIRDDIDNPRPRKLTAEEIAAKEAENEETEDDFPYLDEPPPE